MKKEAAVLSDWRVKARLNIETKADGDVAHPAHLIIDALNLIE